MLSYLSLFVCMCIAGNPYFFDRSDVVQHYTKGETATIECPAGGSPAPKVQLIRDGRVLGTLSSTGFSIQDLSLSDVGDYYCSASSTHVNPPLGKRRIIVNKKVTIHVEGEFCACTLSITLYLSLFLPPLACSPSQQPVSEITIYNT